MTTRQWLAAWFLCACGLVSAADARPNVLLILGDDQSWTDFGFTGHPVIRTPNLDKLATQSAHFTQAYVPSSLCRPSLMTILTGLYPHQHFIVGNDPPRGTDRGQMLRRIETIPSWTRLLAANGYAGFQGGKWWEGSPQLGGFTDFMSHGDPSRGGRHGDVGLKIGRETMEPLFQFLKNRKDQPWFAWYAPMMPHTPHNPPARLLAKYARPELHEKIAKYYAMCEWFDETVGQILEFLDREGLAENTIVLFAVDNGWITNLGPGGGAYAPRSKRSPYEMGLRTPLFVRWPGHVPPGERKEFASTLDLCPTILAACDVPVPPNLPGQNLLDLLAGKVRPREELYGEIFAHDVADLNDPIASLEYRWLRAGRYKLILGTDPAFAPELYDLETDRLETRNLAGEQPERVAQMRQRLELWWPVTPAAKK